jgi:transglutaminase-like putative cysteine protease
MSVHDPDYLRSTDVIDFHHPAIMAFVYERTATAESPTEQAIKLYYAVRDEIRYNPYAIDLSVDGLRASATLKSGQGWCVPKAVLLAACCRALGIPAKLGYADVRNHLSTERMRAYMKTDVFMWHGYTVIYLADKWVKATPAFNIELCRRFQLKPLEFDGRNDSIYHPFDLLGNKHMEYIRDRGDYADVPIDEIVRDFKQSYPDSLPSEKFDFDSDVDMEIISFQGRAKAPK